MKRSIITFIIIVAILSGLPEAIRQYRVWRNYSAEWIKSSLFEGLMNSAEGSEIRREPKRCMPVLSVNEGAVTEVPEPEPRLLGRINIGANFYVIN
ncbi:MAG: hypothetical protein ABIP75_04270 [Pyrinomonadaceae bacterium]